MATTEPIRGLTEPTVGGDTGAWGTELNNTIAALASILGGSASLNSSTYGTTATLTSSQAQQGRVIVVNTSSSPFTLNMPSSNFCAGPYTIANASSNAAATLTVTPGSSVAGPATVSVPSGGFFQRQVYVDANNVIACDNVALTSTTALVNSLGGATGALTVSSPLSVGGSALSFSQTAPTVQRFTGGSGSYAPTSSAVLRIKVTMCAGGGGGGAGQGNNGSAGTGTTFGGWTCGAGGGGAGGGAGGAAGGAGGTGGANGAGTLVMRFGGGDGCAANSNGVGATVGGAGGNGRFGGAGAAGFSGGGGNNAQANTGAGGQGGGSGGVLPEAGGGGGAGESAEFWVTAPSSGGTAYTVGAGGGGGAAGTTAGGNGAAGLIAIEEFYI